MKKRKQKSALLVWIEYIPFWMLYQFIRLIPLQAAYRLMTGSFGLLYYVDVKHRRLACRHILHAGICNSEAEAGQTARRAFGSFGRLLVEIIKLDQVFKPEMIHLSGSARTRAEAYDAGPDNQNVIIVTAHYGNWELAGDTWARNTGIPMVSVMRPFANPKIGELILRNRRSPVHEVISKNGGMRGLLRALKSGKNIALLADQHASSGEGVETLFFGQPCRTHVSPAILHLKTGAPIMPEITRRLDDKMNFEFILGDLIRYEPTGDREKDIKTVTQMYTSALEDMIRQYPDQWLWVHRRWLNIHRKKRHPIPPGQDKKTQMA